MSAGRTGLRAARLFDGRDRIQDATVVIEDGRILAVERRRLEPSSALELIDFGNATLLPGLIDSHVHLGFDAGLDPVGRLMSADDDTLLLSMRLAARRSLAAGVTTVRDLGDRRYLSLDLKDRFDRGDEPGPHILAAGPPLTVAGGHCHFLGGEADGDAQLRRAVRERAERGVDVVKVMVSGGNITPGSSPLDAQYTVHELRAVVDEAHRCDLRVTAHVHGVLGIERAVEAGVDGLEHCGFWVADGVRSDQSLIDRIAERGIAVCPTAGIAPDTPPPPPAVAARMPGMMAASLEMHRSGICLLAGTDAGVAPAKPHGGVCYAVSHLAEAGVPVAAALKGATSFAAEACGLGGRKGVLAAGGDADIVAVDGDPLEDRGALRAVRAVFRAGVRVVLDRAETGSGSRVDVSGRGHRGAEAGDGALHHVVTGGERDPEVPR